MNDQTRGCQIQRELLDPLRMGKGVRQRQNSDIKLSETVYANFHAPNPDIWREQGADPIWRGAIPGTPNEIQRIPGKRKFLCLDSPGAMFEPSDEEQGAYFPGRRDSPAKNLLVEYL